MLGPDVGDGQLLLSRAEIQECRVLIRVPRLYTDEARFVGGRETFNESTRDPGRLIFVELDQHVRASERGHLVREKKRILVALAIAEYESIVYQVCRQPAWVTRTVHDQIFHTVAARHLTHRSPCPCIRIERVHIRCREASGKTDG